MFSVDTAVHPEHGNLSAGQNLDLLLRLASEGLFCLCISGPPCETWSAARHNKLEDTKRRAPRPLRSASKPWGLSQLTMRELKQLTTGSHI